MPDTSNRLYDGIARLMTDAASVAQSVHREAETLVRPAVGRIKFDRAEKFGLGASVLALGKQDIADLGVRTRPLGVELHGAAQLL